MEVSDHENVRPAQGDQKMGFYLRLNRACQNGKFGPHAAKKLSTNRHEDKRKANGAYGTVVAVDRDP